MSTTVPKLAVACHCQLGEGPLWREETSSILWSDITAGHLHEYHPQSNSHHVQNIGRTLGGFTLQSDGTPLLFLDKGGIALWHSQNLHILTDALPGEESTRFNDVFALPDGSVLCGTMPVNGQRSGRLYHLKTNGTIKILLEGIECSNGMGLSPDLKRLYYTDSGKRVIYAFDFDVTTSQLSNQQEWVHTNAADGVPDGMTVDAEGCVWSAHWGGSCIHRYDPSGKVIQRINLDAPKVTSLCFGEMDLSRIFITTAGGSSTADPQNVDGNLFSMDAVVTGLREYRSNIAASAIIHAI